jgi:hypothetical protein
MLVCDKPTGMSRQQFPAQAALVDTMALTLLLTGRADGIHAVVTGN